MNIQGTHMYIHTHTHAHVHMHTTTYMDTYIYINTLTPHNTQTQKLKHVDSNSVMYTISLLASYLLEYPDKTKITT